MQPLQPGRVPWALLVASAGLLSAAGAAPARRTVPADTIVRVRLDDEVSGREARVGNRVRATVTDDDRSGLPAGTRLNGVISEVQHATGSQPGMLDMRFRRAVLPDGSAFQLDGRLASLADDETRRTRDGRVMARSAGDQSRSDAKWVGYGPGADAVLATTYGGGFLKGSLLGGLGGAVYGYLTQDRAGDRASYREVRVPAGTEFGVRLHQAVGFDEQSTYRYPRAGRYDDGARVREKVLGNRSEYRFGSSTVMVGSRRVDFGDLRPMNVNGVLYVPLAAVAGAAGLRYEHESGDDAFSIRTRDGLAEGYGGDARVTVSGRPEIRLTAAPLSVDGEIYVPAEFFNRVADMRVRWDRRNMRLELEPYR